MGGDGLNEGDKMKQEMFMSKLIPLALVALTLIAGTPSAMANNRHDRDLADWSKACGGFSCNSQEGSRVFWQQQT
jgi:hypothetical protein